MVVGEIATLFSHVHVCMCECACVCACAHLCKCVCVCTCVERALEQFTTAGVLMNEGIRIADVVYGTRK